MPKSIKIDDSLYEKLKDFADEECRTVSQTIEYLFKCYKNGRTQPSVEEVPEKNRSVSQAKESNQSNEDKGGEIQRLLIQRSRIVRDLDEKNLVAWVQKKAVEEFWSDEQAKFESDLHRKELERERDLITERLKALGM